MVESESRIMNVACPRSESSARRRRAMARVTSFAAILSLRAAPRSEPPWLGSITIRKRACGTPVDSAREADPELAVTGELALLSVAGGLFVAAAVPPEVCASEEAGVAASLRAAEITMIFAWF